MNKTAIKNYAIWARVNLIEAAKQRAYQYEITKDNITDAGADVVSGKPIAKEEKEQRRQLIDQINRKGFDQVMEEVAYTWFNRFIALRFMEVNGYLPTKIRVFTDSEGNFKPEILKEALTVELPVDKSRVMELLEKQDNEELYKMLLIAQCNELSNGLPDMFEVISNYTELLFPNNLLKEDSILGEMVNTIPEEDWTDAVQIIGWLYQYYNSELKNETFELMKKKIKVSKERIPAATQLFTPDWIVRYMVENSLGRLWYEGHPNDEIKKEWKYYLDEAQQEPEVEDLLKAIREEYKAIKPEDIKVIDPCMGSGHILVYAFDVLMQIYTSAGWSERDAAESILENNLFGLDIDDRAGQLAYFAVMMKARKYSRRILTKNIRPKVFSIQESNNVKIEAWWRLGPEEDIARRLVQELTDAKEYGSILNLSVSTAELQALRKRLDDIEEMSDQGNLLDVIQSDEITRQLYPLVELAEVMVQKYDVVVTNPPYMGSSSMNNILLDYIRYHYSSGKTDLYAAFIGKCENFSHNNGFVSMITMHNWMFLSSFEELRKEILSKDSLVNMAHLGGRAFDEIAGEVVQTVAFVRRKKFIEKYNATYKRLLDGNSEHEKELLFFRPDTTYIANSRFFVAIPGCPVAYWVSEKTLSAFAKGIPLSKYGTPRTGIMTGDNNKFLRLWWETSVFDICLNAYSESEAIESGKKWFPYNKGGSFRRWDGNNDYIVNWGNHGHDIFEMASIEKRNSQDYPGEYKFKQAISWSQIATDKPAFRIKNNCLSDITGACFYCNDEIAFTVLAFCNSIVATDLLNALNPTTHFQSGNIGTLPVLFEKGYDSTADSIAHTCIGLSQNDWNSYETSWEFKKNPLI